MQNRGRLNHSVSGVWIVPCYDYVRKPKARCNFAEVVNIEVCFDAAACLDAKMYLSGGVNDDIMEV